MKMEESLLFDARYEGRMKRPGRKLMAALIAGLIVALALGVFYYWWTHLCGNCGGAPFALPPSVG